MELKRKFVPTRRDKLKLSKVFDATWDGERVYVYSPEKLCIYDEGCNFITYQFIEYVEKIVIENGNEVVIDFKNLKFITAAASLLIFAKISKCQICSKSPNSVDIKLPEDKDVKRTFTNSGLWHGIKPGGIGKIRKLIDTNNQYLSGSEQIVDNVGKIIPATMLSLSQQGVKFSSPNTVIFTRGIQEAILNIKYHAYDKKVLPPNFDTLGSSRWWQCCWLDSTRNNLVFIIYDDGIGIAETLANIYEDIDSDHELIEKAMTIGVSQTQEVSRGKGSNDIIKSASVFPNSHLVIYSGNGYYKNDESGITTRKTAFKLKGTLVQWVLNYKDENANVNL